MANKIPSGFLTDLPQAQVNKYIDSSFRIIKEKSYNNKVNVPVINPLKKMIFKLGMNFGNLIMA